MYDLLFFAALYAPMLVTGVFAMNALGAGSYRRKATRSGVVFLRPVSSVVFGVTMLLNLAAMAALASDPDLEDALFVPVHLGSYVSTRPEAAKVALTAGAAVAFLYWGVLRWYVKTFALVLNLERRTYSTVDFSHVLLKKKTGSWNDITGVNVTRTSAKGTVIFHVRLKLHSPASLTLSLGGFSERDRAEAFAAQMARELDLPLVTS